MIAKNSNNELPIPKDWRGPLKVIADSYVSGTSPEILSCVGLTPMDEHSLGISMQNIADYPDDIGLLSGKSWESSIYIWMGGYWDVLIDFTDSTGEISDLVLSGKMYENGEDYIFEPHLIYVP